MSESQMWETVRAKMHGLDPVRVENPVWPGTPDVNYIHGWIELKFAEKWPVRPTTPLRLDHFTPQQRVWLTRRVRSGGLALLLLHIADEWLLFRGDVAARIIGKAVRPQLVASCLAFWPNSLPEEEFRACLTKSSRMQEKNS